MARCQGAWRRDGASPQSSGPHTEPGRPGGAGSEGAWPGATGVGVLLGDGAGARPCARREGTGNALYWISLGAGKGATRLGLFWAGQHPKGTALAGTWHDPARPTSSQLLFVNFPVLPSAHESPLPCSVLYETAPTARTRPRGETWVQKLRWQRSVPTTCMSRDASHAASTKIWPKPGKPAGQKAALSLAGSWQRSAGPGLVASGCHWPLGTRLDLGSRWRPSELGVAFGSLFFFLSPIPCGLEGSTVHDFGDKPARVGNGPFNPVRLLGPPLTVTSPPQKTQHRGLRGAGTQPGLGTAGCPGAGYGGHAIAQCGEGHRRQQRPLCGVTGPPAQGSVQLCALQPLHSMVA